MREIYRGGSKRKKITFKENKNGCFEITSHKGVGFGYPRISINNKSWKWV